MRRNTPWERPTRREDLAGWYAAMLDRQSESGMSVTDFAASAGVSAWTLYQWRRRLAEDDGGREAAPRLVEVAVLPSAAPATARAAASLSVDLRSGVTVLATAHGKRGDQPFRPWSAVRG